MEIGILPVSSSLHEEEKETIFDELEETSKNLEDFGINTITPPDYATKIEEADEILNQMPLDDLDGLAIFIFTGGTEEIIIESLRDIPLPIFLLGNSKRNSFAAGCEALPKLRSMGKKTKLISREDLGGKQAREIKEFVKVRKTIQKLRRMRLGLIGNKSPWLVSGSEDFQLIEKKIGPKITQLDMTSLLDEIEKVPAPEARKLSQEILSYASEAVEPEKDDIIKASRIYLGLKNLIEKNNLDAVTVGCFEIIPPLNNTGCIALSKLIDEGIIAGCDGDLDTTLTMIIMNLLSGRPAWIANTVSADTSNDVLTFAHCTISTEMLDGDPILRSHFESGKGVAIQGKLKEGKKVTIARLGSSDLNEMLISTGIIEKSDLGREDMCRTQVKIKLDGTAEKFMEKSLGNHVSILKGDISSKLREFSKALGINATYIG